MKPYFMIAGGRFKVSSNTKAAPRAARGAAFWQKKDYIAFLAAFFGAFFTTCFLTTFLWATLCTGFFTAGAVVEVVVVAAAALATLMAGTEKARATPTARAEMRDLFMMVFLLFAGLV